MVRFRKIINFRIVSVFVTVTFLTSSAYGMDLSKSKLRVPISDKTEERMVEFNQLTSSNGKKSYYNATQWDNIKLQLHPEIGLNVIADFVIRELKEMKYKEVIKKGARLSMVEVDQSDLPYPDGMNIGILVPGLAGTEALAYWQAEGKIKDVNFLFLCPFLDIGFGKDHPDMLFTRYAFFIDKEGRPIVGRFKKPIVIHAMEHAGLHRSESKVTITSKSIPLLNSQATIDLVQDKIEFGKLLLENSILTPEFEIMEDIEDEKEIRLIIENFMRDKRCEEIVLKPHDSSFGTGVKMFSGEKIEDAVNHARLLLSQGNKILVQERKRNKFWFDPKTEEYIDFNFRVLTTWEGDEGVIDEDMIEVRYSHYSENPVNISKGAKVMTLNRFFKTRKFSQQEKEDYIEKIRKTIKPALRILEEEVKKRKNSYGHPYKNTGVIGWDLIEYQDKDFYILEANSGSVGGIKTIESLLKGRKKGLAILPVAKYLLEIAQLYKRQHPQIVTDDISYNIDLLDDPALLAVFSTLLAEREENELALSVIERAIQIKPDSAEYWSGYSRMLLVRGGNNKAGLEAAEKALELDPNNVEGKISQAGALCITGEKEEAERLVREILRDDSKNAPAWVILGFILNSQGRFYEEMKALRKAYKLDSPKIENKLLKKFLIKHMLVYSVTKSFNSLPKAIDYIKKKSQRIRRSSI